MVNLDQSTLIAYVDGELDPLTAREVEGQLPNDPKAQEFVKDLCELAALSRVAFHDTLHQAVPQRLQDAISNRATSAAPNDAERPSRSRATPRSRATWRVAWPLAAALGGILLGLGGGVQYAQTRAQSAAQLASFSAVRDQTAMNQALNTALEVKLSGDKLAWQNPDSQRSALFTPVRTYQDKSGRYCREYRQDVTTAGQNETTYGLACRTDQGVWKTRYLILEDAPEAR